MNPMVTNIKMVNDVHVEEFEHKGWRFVFTKGSMLNSTDLDMLSDLLILQGVPDVTNGNNSGLIYNEKSKIGFHVNAKDALYFCNYKHREQNLLNVPETHNVNHISIIPDEVKLSMSDKWKAQDNEIKQLEKISDTFYSTPYKGTVLNEKQIQFWFQRFEAIKKFKGTIFEPQLELKSESDYLNSIFQVSNAKSVQTAQEIPVHKLGQDNPIIWACHIELFADELGDNGLSSCEFRFRVMDDCFFGLLRSYLRVDNVVIRIIDTRIYHEFGQNYILRDHTRREDTWNHIKTKFDFSPQWSVDAQQSFIIQNSVAVKQTFRDQIQF